MAITVISRIEVLNGRFATLLKAANGAELKRGQERLDQAERDLHVFPVLSVNDAVAAQVDNLLRSKAANQVRRGDLLISAIALSHNATLVTRNLKDFKRVPGLRMENWAD